MISIILARKAGLQVAATGNVAAMYPKLRDPCVF